MICPHCQEEIPEDAPTLKYPYEGETLISRYCLNCNKWVPKPLGHWERMWPGPHDVYSESVGDDEGRVLRRR